MTGILDEYPGAAAAYSLRLLNTDYTGDAIVVRRASDNTTQSIGFVDGELDTDTLNTFCSGANGFITTWHDQSGNGNNLTQSTAAAQPKIYDSINGIIELNGKPAIYTDGVDDQLESGVLSLSNPNTQFFAFKTLVNVTNEYVGGLFNGTNTAPSLLGAFSGDNLFLGQQGVDFTPSVPHNQSQLLITAKSSTIGTDWALFKNSSQITNSGENIGVTVGNKIVLGNRNTLLLFSENYFQEYILYNSDETSNRTGIETNINNFYSIY